MVSRLRVSTAWCMSWCHTNGCMTSCMQRFKLTYVNACGHEGGQEWRQADQVCKSLQPAERI